MTEFAEVSGSHEAGRVDPELARIVELLDACGYCIVIESCSGHGRSIGAVGFKVQLKELRRFLILLNVADQMLVTEDIAFDLAVIWTAADAGSEIIDATPDWLGLTLYFGSAGARSGDMRRPLRPLSSTQYLTVTSVLERALAIPPAKLGQRLDALLEGS